MGAAPAWWEPAAGAARGSTAPPVLATRDHRRCLHGEWPTHTENGRWVFDADPWAPTWSGGFLDAVRRTADYFLAHTLDDGVPPNDFRDADGDKKRAR